MPTCATCCEVVTPRDPSQRGCQLSLRVSGGRERGRDLFDFLASRGILGDWREPDVIRISPVPLYNTPRRCPALREYRPGVARWKIRQSTLSRAR